MKGPLQTITPTLAEKYLANASRNRKPDDSTVSRYAADMRAGQWKITGDSIKFNGAGALLDGRHRLLACIRADTPFQTYIVRGIGQDAFSVMDTGRRRTLAVILELNQEKNGRTLAAVIVCAWRFATGRIQNRHTLSNAEALRFLKRHPDLRAATTQGKALAHKSKYLLNATVFGFLVWAYSRAGYEEQVAETLSDLACGTNLISGDPILLFRSRMVAERQRQARISTVTILALAIKAINARIESRELKVLKWEQFGERRESFPSIPGFDVRWKDYLRTIEPEEGE